MFYNIKNALYFKKCLPPIIIRACARAKNLHVSKKDINFAPSFATESYFYVRRILKKVQKDNNNATRL